MQLTEQHAQLRESVVRFVENEINPHVADWEAAGGFPSHEVFKKAGNLGILGVKYDEAYGGLGLDFSYSAVVAEALGACDCGGVPMAIGVQADMATPALHRFGSEDLKRNYLAPTISGDYVACLGVSEPGGGSDVAAVRTTARKDGGDYVINGTKMWITNGMEADWCCLLANTSDGPVHKNKSLIVVPMDAPGITRQKIHKLGMHSSDTAQLFFDDVRVPRANVIGAEGMGFTLQMLQFQEERLWAAANSLTMLDRLIDQTIDYTRQRHAFGKAILDNQVVHFRLAELRTEVECLRSLTWRAAEEEYVGGRDVTRLASMAKLKCGRLTREVADACLQYWGGMGYTADNPISRAYRDGRLVSIGGGADEVMLGIICKLEGTLPRAQKSPLAMSQNPNVLLRERAGGVLRLTLNRPEARNALSLELLDALIAALHEAEQSGVRVVVLHGAGGHFSAGADLKDMAVARAAPVTADRDPVAETNARFGHLCAAYAGTPLVTIAVLEGAVMGGGFGLACCVDVAIASETVDFRLPEVSLGVIPAQIAPFLVERLGYSEAKRLAVTAARLGAAEAYRLGLVHQVCEGAAALEAAADAAITQALACAPGAIADTKALLRHVRFRDPGGLADYAASAFARSARGEEAAEGIRAFIEKRKASWANG